MSTGCVVIIPARLASERISEKPLVDLCGKPLIQRVYERAAALKKADEVTVATDSEKVAAAVKKFGGKYVMTPSDIRSGSDRVYYAAVNYFPEADIIVNIQGDEPFLDTEFLDSLIDTAWNSPEGLFSAYFPVERSQAEDPSVVKVVVDNNNEALFFSRSMIPSGASEYKKHLGVYIWKKWLLEKFYNWPATPLESLEKLEQLRVLENSCKIKMAESPADSVGIDTYDDVARAVRWINEN